VGSERSSTLGCIVEVFLFVSEVRVGPSPCSLERKARRRRVDRRVRLLVMVQQMALPIAVLAGITARSAQGLALSPRNGYLSEAEKTEALRLQATLRDVIAQWQSGRRDGVAIEAEAMAHLAEHGWQPDDVVLLRQHDLGAAQERQPLVALAAAKLGKTRLIDNLEVAG
jgi:pantoate--beta-alanine ligase